MKKLSNYDEQGFNLIDLLVSLLLGSIVISLGGTALSSIVSANQNSTGQQDIQNEASQALEFIVTESRQAQSFIADPSLLNALNDPSSSFQTEVNKVLPASVPKQPVVVLDIGLGSGESIVYFLASAISPWEGLALYRWGPPFDQDGNYVTDPALPSNPIVPPLNNWVPSLLIDKISADPSSPNCTPWSLVPPTIARGFYACVDPQGRIAKFVFQSESLDEMELKAKAFARSQTP